MPGSPTLPLEPAQPEIVWTVSELLGVVKEELETGYATVWVRGEITNFRRQASGHWYFNLVDDDAVLNVAMFRGDNLAVPFRPEDGLEVTAIGRLTIFERAGRFQLIANVLEPVGWGAQQLAFEQLKRKLQAEGLFDLERKRPLPLLPECVGVVTSSSGAAWHDMTRVWERRGIGLRVILAPSRVQGAGAATEIAAALDLLDSHGGPEVVIVGRGGGSREDLWAFNEEPVARALVRHRVPVIAAVGHEVDTTIADLCADVRAATPTAAAEIVAPSRDELEAMIAALRRQAASALELQIQRAARRLNAPALRRSLARPAHNLQSYQQRLDATWGSLETSMKTTRERRTQRLRSAGASLARANPSRLAQLRRDALTRIAGRLRSSAQLTLHRDRERLGRLAGRTEAMSPLAVLGRGYALCQDRAGRLLTAASDAQVGDQVAVRLAVGRLECEVRGVDPGD